MPYLDDFDPVSKLKDWQLTALVAVVAFVIIFSRLWNLSAIPPIITCDEASIGLNADLILKTGRDEWGAKIPLFFKAFGEYKSPIFIYSTIPFIKTLGLNLFSLRLTTFFWGFLTIIAATLLVWELTKNKTAALISFVIIGFLPWHFQMSRLGYEAITFPALLTVSLWLLAKKKFALCALIFGLTILTYPTARFFVPIYFLIVISLLVDRPFKRLVAAVTFMLSLTPLAVVVLQNPAIIFSRLNEVSIFSQLDPVQRFFENYLSYFSPSFLFLKGSPDILFSTQKSGALFLALAPALVIGVMILIKLSLKLNYWSLFVLLGLVSFPLAAALTFDNQPHLLRAANALPFFVIAMTLGVWYLLKKLPKVISLVFIVSFIIEVALFLYDFNFQYPDRVLANKDLKRIEVTGFTRKELSRFYK